MLRIRVCGSVIESCPHYGTMPPPTKLPRNVSSHQVCAAFKIFNNYCQMCQFIFCYNFLFFKIYKEPANKGYANKNFIEDIVFRGDDEIWL